MLRNKRTANSPVYNMNSSPKVPSKRGKRVITTAWLISRLSTLLLVSKSVSVMNRVDAEDSNLSPCVAVQLPFWSALMTENCHSKSLWGTRRRTRTTPGSRPRSPATSTTPPSPLSWVEAGYVVTHCCLNRPFGQIMIWFFFLHDGSPNHTCIVIKV